MYSIKEQKAIPEVMPAPAPISLVNLRRHFKEVYGFNTSQIDVMVESSSKSLVQAFGNAAEALGEIDPQEKLILVFHGIKGLFLNMGENDWAAFAREVEQRLKTGIPCDFNRVVAEMQTGMSDMLNYCRDKEKGKT